MILLNLIIGDYIMTLTTLVKGIEKNMYEAIYFNNDDVVSFNIVTNDGCIGIFVEKDGEYEAKVYHNRDWDEESPNLEKFLTSKLAEWAKKETWKAILDEDEDLEDEDYIEGMRSEYASACYKRSLGE